MTDLIVMRSTSQERTYHASSTKYNEKETRSHPIKQPCETSVCISFYFLLFNSYLFIHLLFIYFFCVSVMGPPAASPDRKLFSLAQGTTIYNTDTQNSSGDSSGTPPSPSTPPTTGSNLVLFGKTDIVKLLSHPGLYIIYFILFILFLLFLFFVDIAKIHITFESGKTTSIGRQLFEKTVTLAPPKAHKVLFIGF